MGNNHEAMVQTLRPIKGYAKYFKQAFGIEEITKERVAKAIADYERTRMSGNSSWDRWQKKHDEGAVSEEVKKGHELFFGKAACNQCHLGDNLTDNRFHNLGVGWDPKAKKFADLGRFAISKAEEDKGAFKTPTLREVTKHAPYMHDGSLKTLREVVEHYNKGGDPNPHLSPKIQRPKLTEAEMVAVRRREVPRGPRWRGVQGRAARRVPAVTATAPYGRARSSSLLFDQVPAVHRPGRDAADEGPKPINQVVVPVA